MLRFILEVFTVATVLATAGYAVAGAYQFIRRKLSKEAATRDAPLSVPAPPLVDPLILLPGVPCERPEPPPASAELHNETSTGGAFMTSQEMTRYRRRFDLKFLAFLFLGALFWLGIFAGFFWLGEHWEAFRNAVATLILRLPCSSRGSSLASS